MTVQFHLMETLFFALEIISLIVSVEKAYNNKLHITLLTNRTLLYYTDDTPRSNILTTPGPLHIKHKTKLKFKYNYKLHTKTIRKEETLSCS